MDKPAAICRRKIIPPRLQCREILSKSTQRVGPFAVTKGSRQLRAARSVNPDRRRSVGSFSLASERRGERREIARFHLRRNSRMRRAHSRDDARFYSEESPRLLSKAPNVGFHSRIFGSCKPPRSVLLPLSACPGEFRRSDRRWLLSRPRRNWRNSLNCREWATSSSFCRDVENPVG